MSIMAMQPPIKTTLDDINALGAYLRNKVGWSDTDDVKKRIPPKHADNRKIEAMRYIGLLERDGSNIKLSDAGRKYASATDVFVRSGSMPRSKACWRSCACLDARPTEQSSPKTHSRRRQARRSRTPIRRSETQRSRTSGNRTKRSDQSVRFEGCLVRFGGSWR